MENKSILGKLFNFSTEHSYSVQEIIQKIISLMTSERSQKILNQSTNEIKDQYLSAKTAKKILDGNSRYSLDHGLNETVEWHVNSFNKDHCPVT